MVNVNGILWTWNEGEKEEEEVGNLYDLIACTHTHTVFVTNYFVFFQWDNFETDLNR